MCMPIGHTLAGIAWFTARVQLSRLSTPVNDNRYELLISLLLFVFFSNIPDVDFLPYILTRDFYYYAFHHMWSHSIGAAVIVSLLYRYIAPARVRVYCTSKDVFILFITHLLLDVFTYDFTPPYGIQLLWPFWDGFVYSNISFFCFIFKWWPSTIELHQLISTSALISYIWEMVFFGAIIITILWRNRILKDKFDYKGEVS